MLPATIKLPTVEEIKQLTISDIAIMSGLANSLKERLREYIQIDPYTTTDPFGDKDDYDYTVIIDRIKSNRLVAMLATTDSPPHLPWNSILTEHLINLSLSKQDAIQIKYELMPKDTNNFYPYRSFGKIVGYIMFTFQMCGQRS